MEGVKIMGMFDSIQCNHPLPLPLEIIDLIPDIYEQEIQTKDLDCSMTIYILEEDGKLLREDRKYEWKDDDSYFLKGYFETVETKIEDSRFHGIVNFYLYERLYTDETRNSGLDVSIDFLGKFNNGVLESIDVLEYNIEDASESIKQIKEVHEKWEIKRNKWYNKYFFYTKPIAFIRKKIVRFFYNLHTFTGKLHTLAIRYI